MKHLSTLFTIFSLLFATAGMSQLTVNVTHTDALCFGNCDGSATASATGGVPPYTYTWFDFTTGLPIGQSGTMANSLCAGDYYVQVTDDVLTTVNSNTIFLLEPTDIFLSTIVTDASCFGICDGSITGSATGGTPPYTYQWYDALFNPVGVGQTLPNVCAGNYTFEVTDSNGCTKQSVATVTEPSPIITSIVGTDASCFGICDGMADLTVSGGTPPYTYLWVPGAITSEDITNLCAGIYSVTVTDANGCTVNDNVTINEPTVLTLSMSGSNVTCNGFCDGTGTANPTGGTPPYTYIWDAAAGNQTTQTAISLCPGTYSVTATDVNGCNVVNNVTITQPAALSTSIVGTDATCNGSCDGSADLTVSGGDPPYTYDWGFATTEDISGLCAGVYSVTVTDNSGCMQTNNVVISEPPQITITTTPQDIFCFGNCTGNITAVAAGGTGSFLFEWFDDLMNPIGVGPTISNLCPGNYNLRVTDANGCFATALITINAPTQINVVTTVNNVSCNGVCDGMATVNVTGGTPPYAYMWDDPLAQTTMTAGTLCAGNYTCTITDANGCVEVENVTISEPTAVGVTSALTNDNCAMCTGEIDVTATGGTPGYIYSVDGGVTFQPTPTFQALCAGPYNVVVQDANGCTGLDNPTILNNATCDSVYPGDTDYDGIANNMDLLPIGAGWGIGDLVRAGATLNWVGQVCGDWAAIQANGENYKHADTDGNGLINDDDTTAIMLNYGYVHGPDDWKAPRGGQPPLWFDIQIDTTGLGMPLDVPLNIGTSGNPVDSILGVAFTVLYDPSLVDSLQPIYMDFANSDIGTPGFNTLTIQYNIYTAGRLEAAITRTDGQIFSGWGNLGTFSVVTTDNLSGKKASVNVDTFTLDITDVYAIAPDGSQRLLTVDPSDDIIVSEAYVGMGEGTLNAAINVWPNPASDRIFLEMKDGLPADNITVTDMLGRELITTSPIQPITHIQTDNLPNGVYLINVLRDGQTAVKKIIIRK